MNRCLEAGEERAGSGKEKGRKQGFLEECRNNLLCVKILSKTRTQILVDLPVHLAYCETSGLMEK